jgi:hypothetical protein
MGKRFEEYERKLKQWEAEGFDVSELRERWFSPKETKKAKKPGMGFKWWIAVSLLSLVIIGSIVSIVFMLDNDKNHGSIERATQCSLSRSVSPPGSGSISPGSGYYGSGTVVTLTATPSSGYQFDHWGGDVLGSSSSVSITMNSNKNVIAYFKPSIQYSLSTSVSPPGSGSISPGSGTYDSGTVITLTATPLSGYQFDHWEGDASGRSSSVSITMNSSKNITAYFEKLYQVIEYTMPPGAVSRSSVSYSQWLEAGEQVDGLVELTGEYHSSDWSYSWDFQVFGPGGESVHYWLGHWVNTPQHSFEFTASYAGEYKIKVSHVSFYQKNLTINIWPPGWGYSG